MPRGVAAHEGYDKADCVLAVTAQQFQCGEN